MKKEILRMERVTLKEDGDTQLENFSLTVWEGEIVGLVPVDNHGLEASAAEYPYPLRIYLL